MFKSLVDAEKRWFVDEKWKEPELINCYATVVAGIDDFVEILDSGNSARLTAYHAKAAAIKELVPDVESLAKCLFTVSL